MESQTITIEVAPEVAEILRTLEGKARALGVTLDSLLSPLVPTNGTPEERPLYETATPQELAAAITGWMDSHNPNTPALPLEAVSRESIYEGR